MKLYKQEIEKLIEKIRITTLKNGSYVEKKEDIEEKIIDDNDIIKKDGNKKGINEYRDGRIYYNKYDIKEKNISKGVFERYNIAKKYCKNKIVVDCACGCGYGSYILSEKAKYVFGYDISENAIEFARKNWQKINISFNIFDMTKNKLPLKYDVIVCIGSIEHFNIPIIDIIKKFKKQLKKNGILYLHYPENEDIGTKNKFGVGRSKHYHGNLTNDNMIKILKDLNLKIIYQKFQFGDNSDKIHNNIIVSKNE